MASDPQAQADAPEQGESLETSNYDVIRRRLVEQGRQLGQLASALNDRRQAFFGTTSMEVVDKITLSTDNNCRPQDIINLGDHLLFGYNVSTDLKKTTVEDVFKLHHFERRDGHIELRHLEQDASENFLGQPTFRKDFDELYTYYKDSNLRQLRRVEGRLLAIFQIGATLADRRVLRWGVTSHDEVTYMDNAGDRDNVTIATHDFEWVPTRREDHVTGRHPHINILNTIFVETVGGDLNIKVENNTEDGQGIYVDPEPIQDRNQSLGDADILYARLGELIVLKIKPYREERFRYLVFNVLTREVARLDAIGLSCAQLPESHGLIFPAGYILESGEVKTFEMDVEGMRLERVRPAPNGEDVLYVFYRPSDGSYLLMSYNLIRKEVQSPILCHGYSIFDDGKMVIFRHTGAGPTRVHPMQVWSTPFVTEEYAASAPSDGSFMARIGNADLVRGISDALSIRKAIGNQQPTMEIYTAIISAAERMLDQYYWLPDAEVGGIVEVLRQVIETASTVIDEFRKVRELRDQATSALAAAEEAQNKLFGEIRYANWKEIDRFVDGLDRLRGQRGKLITLKEMKYMDLARVDALEAEQIAQYDRLSRLTVDFLLGEEALSTYVNAIQAAIDGVDAIETTPEANEARDDLDRIGEGLNLLTEVIGGLKIDDPQARMQIIERLSELLGQQNRARAMLEARRRALLEQEGKAEFAVQFQLLSQSVSSALGMAETPERCEELLTRMMVQLEEMESRFSEFDLYLAKLSEKREEIYKSFEKHKQQLMAERQRKVSNTVQAAESILKGIVHRAQTMTEVDALNAYFAADVMVNKVRELAGKLRSLDDKVKADDLEAQLKATRDQAIRTLRDKVDLFEGGDGVIKLGRHRFSVNTQEITLTTSPHNGEETFHIKGTDYYEPITDPEFVATRDLWDQERVSETPQIYRGEYLAATLLFDTQAARGEAGVEALHKLAADDEALFKHVQQVAAERLNEGYERGVHDADAAAILKAVLGLYETTGLLRYASEARALACLFWATAPAGAEHDARPSYSSRAHQPASPQVRQRVMWSRRAQSLARLRRTFNDDGPLRQLAAELTEGIEGFVAEHALDVGEGVVREAAAYLVEELRAEPPRFVTSAEAQAITDAFWDHLEFTGARAEFEEDLRTLTDDLGAREALVRSWLAAFLGAQTEREDQPAERGHLLREAATLILTHGQLEREVSSANTNAEVGGLLGQHPRIENQRMVLRLDTFMSRLRRYVDEHVPRYLAYQELAMTVSERERKRLRLDELKPRVLSTFVRNQLIDQVYLPIIGDNLAKQMGTASDTDSSARQGMLLLISPPGYGKTTLMEYVANRLGLVFMKINAPALGHHVTSLDPSEAPNATARQEVFKINLALRMGNNVMLYLDDIQHTNPELLQKFISLCDGTRRIEGVWDGETKTYDLRGKRFAVVMAGNPYTETGERFQIPDMLANRADTYNLGDILNGAEDAFALSYLENALTANSTLAPLANRDRQDTLKFIRMAQGESIPLSELSHAYSPVEAGEIVKVFERLLQCQEVLLMVNQMYIRSASQDDAFRTEPPFKLQGSYRNMTKLAEKVVSAMNDEELQALIDDHYTGESQTLTTDAEQNLLKLAQLRGRMTPEQEARWEVILQEFRRRKLMGGGDDDPVGRVVGPLASMVQRFEDMHAAMSASPVAAQIGDLRASIEQAALSASKRGDGAQDQSALLSAVERVLGQLGERMRPELRPEIQVRSEVPEAMQRLMQQQTALMEGTLKALQSMVEANAAAPRVVHQVVGAPMASPPAPPQVSRPPAHDPYTQAAPMTSPPGAPRPMMPAALAHGTAAPRTAVERPLPRAISGTSVVDDSKYVSEADRARLQAEVDQALADARVQRARETGQQAALLPGQRAATPPAQERPRRVPNREVQTTQTGKPLTPDPDEEEGTPTVRLQSPFSPDDDKR